MRLVVVIAIFLSLTGHSHAAQRVQGFLTSGCDTFFRPSIAAETWKVDLSKEQLAELKLMAAVVPIEENPWVTLYVDVQGELSDATQKALASDRHAKSFHITHVYSARYPRNGETTKAAIGPRAFRGFLLMGPHGAGFISSEQKDELWWVVERGVRWTEILKFFPRYQNALEQAEVKVVGSVGPPGAYGAMNEYNREVAIDQLHFLRRVAAGDLKGTAGLWNPDAPATPAINRCAAGNRQ